MAALLVAAVSMFAVTDAMAQFGGGMPGGRARGGRMDRGGSPGLDRPAMQEQESMTDLVAFRLELLQEDLKLSREQERAWINYEERTKALAADISRERSRTQSAMSMNAMQQVNHAVDTARDRLTAWEEIASAAKALYDSLTPQQKELADARFPSIVSALSAGSANGSLSRSEGTADKRGPGRSPGWESK
jgi:hypothetical protein